MGAAPAASAAGAEAAAAKPEDLGTAGLALQGRMICAAATAALKSTADAKDIKDGQYSSETPSGTCSPVTLGYSSGNTTEAAIGTAGAEAAAAGPRDPGAAELVSQGRLICEAATAA